MLHLHSVCQNSIATGNGCSYKTEMTFGLTYDLSPQLPHNVSDSEALLKGITQTQEK